MQTSQLQLTIIVASPLIVTSATLPGLVVGQAYSYQMQASGGTPPYSWSGSGLPPGLVIGSSGLISGMPTQAGSFTATITVTDSGA